MNEEYTVKRLIEELSKYPEDAVVQMRITTPYGDFFGEILLTYQDGNTITL